MRIGYTKVVYGAGFDDSFYQIYMKNIVDMKVNETRIGRVVGGVADAIHEKVSALIYLDAVIPVNGKSVFDFQFEERWQLLLAQAAGYNGWQIPQPPVSIYGIYDPDQQAWANAECVPQPLKCFLNPVQ